MSDDSRRLDAAIPHDPSMREMLDNNPDIIARFGPDLRHLFINRAVAGPTNRRPEDFIGKTLDEMGTPALLTRMLKENIQRVFDTGEGVSADIAFPTPRGMVSLYTCFVPEKASDGSGKVESVLCVSRDVTEFKRIERELRAAQAQFQSFMDNSPMIAYMKDEQGRYIYLNQRFRQRFPEAQERRMGKTVWDVVPPELAERVQKNDQEVLTFGGTTSTVEKYPHHQEEDSFWQSYKFLVTGEEDKRFVGGFSVEITAQKRAEAERERLLAELQETNKRLVALNAEKNAFLGICTHDLKNPLSGIIGMAGLLKEEAGEGSETAGYANDILESAEFMFALVNNLLNVAAIEEDRFPLELDTLNLRSLAAHVLGRYREAAAKKDIALANVEPPADGTEGAAFSIRADRNATLQVLDNLISNAIKYTPLGGQVSVRVLVEPAHGRVTAAIADSGPGLGKEEQAKLFQKFTRLSTKPTGGEHSTGLGLSIVKRLMGAMGGDVRCESQPGKGTTFFAEFPMAERAAG